MSKGLFSKEEAPNKRIVQNTIYKWVSEKFGKRRYPTTIIMLPGNKPIANLLLYKAYFYKPIIHAFENNFTTARVLRNQIDTLKRIIDFRLHCKDVKEAYDFMSIEDLDFCTNLFSDRRRRLPNVHFSDTFAVIRRRLALMTTATCNIRDYKAFMFTVSLRNGLGKTSTIMCIESLMSLTGYILGSIDGVDPQCDYSKGYREGKRISGSGTKHLNGATYYAYEHIVEVAQSGSDLYAKRDLEARMFTYTDGSPMLAFCIVFK